MIRVPGLTHGLKWVAFALMGLVIGACGWFDDPTPETVRLFMDGDAGKEIEIVVSQAFGATLIEDGGTRVTVGVSDTLIRTMPFDTTIAILGGTTPLDPARFFFQAKRLNTDLAQFTVEAYLDGVIKYNQSGPLATEVYLWAFTLNQAIGEIEEVL